MNVYESPEMYSTELNMSLAQAEIRLAHFEKAREKMKQSRQCPKCQQYTLKVEGGEWESGVRDWVYCANEKIEKTDDGGDSIFVDCDFTDDVKNEYLFAFHHDFDAVLMMACGLDIHDEKAVLHNIGEAWSKFVEKDTKKFTQLVNVS
ncbi:hypothetical protein ACQKNX_22850 [Lysinibacillus sp. NPDC093712]|uniref:hypothetical protein n=1 Tax=Lysinibacillus sp. NPDC093712 TaxID=3390579 RepID=UPI003D024BAB